MSYKTFK